LVAQFKCYLVLPCT